MVKQIIASVSIGARAYFKGGNEKLRIFSPPSIVATMTVFHIVSNGSGAIGWATLDVKCKINDIANCNPSKLALP